MARVHGIAVLGLILVGAGLWFAFAEGESPPPLPTAAADAPPPRVAADRAETGRIEPPPPSPSANPPPAAAAPAPTPGPAAAGAAPVPTVEVHLGDLATKAPLPSFQWRWRSGEQGDKGTGKDGIAALPIPRGAVVELLLECSGYEPLAQRDVAVPAAGAPLRLDLFLTPAARATGVRLTVRDDHGVPVPRLQVACYRLAEAVVWRTGDAPLLPAAGETPLWTRQATAGDGVYALPELAPSRYTFEVAALLGDGSLRPLLPAFRTFAVSGSNAWDETIDLQPGTVLTLELVDPQGQTLDPQARGGVSVRLRRVGDDRAVDWLSTTGPRRCSADAMPAASPIQARLPLPAGNYGLEVLCGGALRLSTSLLLRAGDRQTERFAVP